MKKRPQTIAKAIDLNKNKIMVAGLALIAGLLTMAAMINTAHASTHVMKLPFLKTQHLIH
jgi:hypothetical protein